MRERSFRSLFELSIAGVMEKNFGWLIILLSTVDIVLSGGFYNTHRETETKTTLNFDISDAMLIFSRRVYVQAYPLLVRLLYIHAKAEKYNLVPIVWSSCVVCCFCFALLVYHRRRLLCRVFLLFYVASLLWIIHSCSYYTKLVVIGLSC
jgi:hypothetical protein